MSQQKPLIIDCHGHYTTAPKALEEWRNKQIAGIKDPASMPKVSDLKISDDELRESIETNQWRLMKERGSDITLFSPRASFMAHHIGDFQVSSTWAAICNELCYRVSQLFPDNFVPVAMLPQSPGKINSSFLNPSVKISDADFVWTVYDFIGRIQNSNLCIFISNTISCNFEWIRSNFSFHRAQKIACIVLNKTQ